MSERETLFVEVILPIPIYKQFTYRVPFELNTSIKKGIRVIVPFGNSKFITGIVTNITQEIPSYQVKYVEHVLDESPIITGNQFKLWKWMAKYYMSPIGDVMNAALPSNFKIASETKIVIHPDFDSQKNALSEHESNIIDHLIQVEMADIKDLASVCKIKSIQPIIKKMLDKKLILSQEELNDRFTPKTDTYIYIAEAFREESTLNELLSSLDGKSSKKNQLDLLLRLIKDNPTFPLSEDPILKKTLIREEFSISTLQTLVKKGVLVEEKFEISRIKDKNNAIRGLLPLAPSQEKALQAVQSLFDQDKTVLLHGVTGSGKTEIYVYLIQSYLDQGKQVLFLIPEIALTTQLIQRLNQYFGDQVGVYHSKFNQNERVEIWNHVLHNHPTKFRVIIGARSSIFLPFQDLGLVIVDEEHESSFKQYDPSPRYNGRDAAIVLGSIHKAKILLGSATPSLESYTNAKQGKFGLVELFDRFGGIQLPEVQCADLGKERKQKSMHSHFSSFLIEEMREVLNNKGQIILFQNRRGYTPQWSCEICSWVPKCNQCDVTLTYHKHSNLLKCHYCGYVTPPVGTCNSCGSNRIKMLGFGTEKIEDELSLIFPQKNIQRLDLDATRSKNAYETIIQQFEERQIDILVGTQMITKGLDFDHVHLVGILDADMLLNRPDFRAFERSFQLMTQVAGRAGRKEKRGKVIIQTTNPDHWVIQKVMQHDFISFYQQEIIERKQFFYPPFYKFIELTLKHKDENVLNLGASVLAQNLRNTFKERVLGPEYPPIKRIQNYYLKKISIKIEKELSDIQIKEHIQNTINEFYIAPLHKSIKININVDPL